MAESNDPCEPRTDTPKDAQPLVLDASQLFQGKKEIWIDHEGVRYRLRVTRRNKLILQK